MKRSRWPIAIILVITMLLGMTSSLSALDQVKDDEAMLKIESLMERGILRGDGVAFHADRKLTNAEGVQMIVKGLDLSLAAFLFMKEPLASDSFDRVPDDAWYSQAFVIGAVNGLELPRDINPKAEMTREVFAHHLITAMNLKGDFPFTKMLFHLTDEADLNPDYSYALQLLLNGRIVTLDDEGRFRPKDAIKRGEAAVMLYNMIDYVERFTASIPEEGITPIEGGELLLTDEVTYVIEELNEEVSRVTLSWGEQPHPGYGISVAAIHFHDGEQAVIQFRLHYPDPELFYPQVITYPTAVTYVPAAYTVELQQVK